MYIIITNNYNVRYLTEMSILYLRYSVGWYGCSLYDVVCAAGCYPYYTAGLSSVHIWSV